MLEAALVIPILLFLLFGIFLLGYWMFALQVVTAAAREGARVGALTNDNGQIAGAVMQSMRAIDTIERRISIEVDPREASARSFGNPLTVRVRYTIPFRFLFFETEYVRETGRTYPFGTVVGQATARMEYLP